MGVWPRRIPGPGGRKTARASVSGAASRQGDDQIPAVERGPAEINQPVATWAEDREVGGPITHAVDLVVVVVAGHRNAGAVAGPLQVPAAESIGRIVHEP